MRGRKSLGTGIGAALLVALVACSSGQPSQVGSAGPAGSESVSNSSVLDPAQLATDGIVGKGKNGETPAAADVLKLSDTDKAKVAAGKYKIAVAMQTMDIDWSRLTLNGIEDTCKSLGIEIVGVTDAKFDVQQQIADIENLITKKPDLIISIPTDDVATAEAYKKVSAAGIKLVFIHMPAAGLTWPKDYQSVVAPDNQGNGEIAAKALSSYIPQNGSIGIVDYAVNFYTTNQRTLRVKEWYAQNRPDVTVKYQGFTDTNNVGPVTANFVTANPNLNGLFIIWDSPATQSIASLRSAGVHLPITTIDLGNEDAVEMASPDSYIKAVGAQRPYDQGVAEALAAANALLGNQTPAWVALPAIPVTPKNILTSYKEIFRTDPPKELTDACAASGACG
jgi:ribose transport system substrate-binding protein